VSCGIVNDAQELSFPRNGKFIAPLNAANFVFFFNLADAVFVTLRLHPSERTLFIVVVSAVHEQGYRDKKLRLLNKN